MPLTAEARERMEAALDFNPERPRITLRREDVHNALASLARAEESARDAGRVERVTQRPHDLPAKPWTQTAAEWFGIILIVVIAAYLGWLGGHGLL